jgi:DNA-nicking Smr family endonuclease
VRQLSPDEAALWQKVAATIRPLSREPVDPSPEPAKTMRAGRSPAPRLVNQAPSHRPRALQDSTLDGTWDRRLGSGTVEPDRIVDLHGLTLDGAWQAIDRALEQAIGAGERVILLITGHHRPGDPPVARGRIRAAVHDWLAASRHAPSIAAVRGAHRRHGGGGSLYLVLRRR